MVLFIFSFVIIIIVIIITIISIIVNKVIDEYMCVCIYIYIYTCLQKFCFSNIYRIYILLLYLHQKGVDE